MPIVTVWPTPSGLPTASTTSPTRIAFESPIARTGRFFPSILTTARSLAGSAPISLPLTMRRSDSSTSILVASSIDVVVGQDVAVVADDDARAKAALQLRRHLPPAAAALAEEVAERRALGELRQLRELRRGLRLDANGHDRRGHFRHHVREAFRRRHGRDRARRQREPKWRPQPSWAQSAWRSTRRPKRGQDRGPRPALLRNERDIARSSMSVRRRSGLQERYREDYN